MMLNVIKSASTTFIKSEVTYNTNIHDIINYFFNKSYKNYLTLDPSRNLNFLRFHSIWLLQLMLKNTLKGATFLCHSVFEYLNASDTCICITTHEVTGKIQHKKFLWLPKQI